MVKMAKVANISVVEISYRMTRWVTCQGENRRSARCLIAMRMEAAVKS